MDFRIDGQRLLWSKCLNALGCIGMHSILLGFFYALLYSFIALGLFRSVESKCIPTYQLFSSRVTEQNTQQRGSDPEGRRCVRVAYGLYQLKYLREETERVLVSPSPTLMQQTIQPMSKILNDKGIIGLSSHTHSGC